MKPFDVAFPELARRECRVVQTVDPKGNPMGQLLFREYYCSVAGCDCRRVVIGVEWLEGGGKLVTTIDYDFDKQRGQPQIRLDLEGPQSEASGELFAMFTDMVGEAGYRKTLHAHYALWKRAVDDPAHPAHAQAADRPRRKRAPKPRASRAGEPSSLAGGLQKLAANGKRANSKVQQRFAKLIKKVEQQKVRLRGWQDVRSTIARELAANEALFATQRELGRELVRLFDRHHPHPIFTKPERKRLKTLLCELARDLLVAEPDDEIKAIYNRHSRGDFDAEQAQDSAAHAREMKSVMEEMLGIDLGKAEHGSVEELEAHADEVLRGMEEQAAGAHARRKPTPKQTAKELRHEAERQQVGKALQEIYRKLAVTLHPDLELDPAERARKTELMQQVNAAYEAKDLLKLLELQLRFEQVDPDKLDAIAEDRLKRYNTILEEQSRQLAEELHELELPFRMELDLPPPARIVPDLVLVRLRMDASDARQRIDALRKEVADFADPLRLKAKLRAAVESRRSPWDDRVYG